MSAEFINFEKYNFKPVTCNRGDFTYNIKEHIDVHGNLHYVGYVSYSNYIRPRYTIFAGITEYAKEIIIYDSITEYTLFDDAWESLYCKTPHEAYDRILKHSQGIEILHHKNGKSTQYIVHKITNDDDEMQYEIRTTRCNRYLAIINVRGSITDDSLSFLREDGSEVFIYDVAKHKVSSDIVMSLYCDTPEDAYNRMILHHENKTRHIKVLNDIGNSVERRRYFL
jgi:hypothetical protein